MKCLLLALVIICFSCFIHPSSEERKFGRSSRIKRNILIFPSGSILQLSLGVAMPHEIPEHTAQLSFGIQQNIKLPTNITELRHPPVRSKRVLNVYENLEQLLSSYGMNGLECLKKMVCQVANKSMDAGLLEEVVAFIFRPSLHMDDYRVQSKLNAEGLLAPSGSRGTYLLPEKLGEAKENCTAAFPGCPLSPLDLITL